MGADDVPAASKKVWSETCEMSTIMPSRFISRITSLPKSVSPFGPSGLPEEPAQGVLIPDIALRELALGVERRSMAGDEAVDDCDVVAAGHELVDRDGADVAGATDYEDVHRRTAVTLRTA